MILVLASAKQHVHNCLIPPFHCVVQRGVSCCFTQCPKQLSQTTSFIEPNCKAHQLATPASPLEGEKEFGLGGNLTLQHLFGLIPPWHTSYPPTPAQLKSLPRLSPGILHPVAANLNVQTRLLIQKSLCRGRCATTALPFCTMWVTLKVSD